MTIKTDMMQTVAIALIVYYFGRWLKTKISILEKFCIPAPVVGGIVFSLLHLVLKQAGILSFDMDTTLQSPFMMVFFTTIGLGASIDLIKKGGLGVFIFLIVATVLVALQDVLGVVLAKVTGANPLIGLLCGSITMTGGHGTAGAWGPTFEKEYGLVGGQTIGYAAATFGLVFGSLIGGPVGSSIIRSKGLKTHGAHGEGDYDVNKVVAVDETLIDYHGFMRHFTIIIIAIGFGAVVSELLKRPFPDFKLPAYVTAMIVAAILRNTIGSKMQFSDNITSFIGDIGLNVFLSIALCGLKLWELADVAGPMLVILIGQTVMMALFARFVTYNIMGRDFDAATIAAGHCGFGMGATPNGVANMQSIVETFGPAPRAFFILPIVGAFFIDFTNSFIITAFINFVK